MDVSLNPFPKKFAIRFVFVSLPIGFRRFAIRFVKVCVVASFGIYSFLMCLGRFAIMSLKVMLLEFVELTIS